MRKLIVCIAVCFALILGVEMPAKNFSAKANQIIENYVDFTVNVDGDRDIRVLQLTDTQIIDSMQSNRTGWAPEMWATDKMNSALFQCITAVVTKAQPDFIIITGDVVFGEFDDNGTSLLRLIAVMDSFKIPWSPVFGNHDNESKLGVDWQCEQLEKSQYCLFKQRQLTGNGNYTVGLTQNNLLKRVFYMLDTNGCKHASQKSLQNGHFSTTEGLAKDQIEWVNQSMASIKEAFNDVEFSMAYHIQNSIFAKALTYYGYPSLNVNVDTATNKKDGDFGYFGHSVVQSWDTDYSLFNLWKSLGMDSIFVGHEHQNSASVIYDGVRLAYGLKTGTYDTINWLMSGKVENGVVSGTVQGGNPLNGKPLVGGTVIVVSKIDGKITDTYHIYYGEEDSKINVENIDVQSVVDNTLSIGLGKKYFSYISESMDGATDTVFRVTNVSTNASMTVNLKNRVLGNKKIVLKIYITKYNVKENETPYLTLYPNKSGYNVKEASSEEVKTVYFTPSFNKWFTIDITDAVKSFLDENGKASSFILVFNANAKDGSNVEKVYIDEFQTYEVLSKEWEDTFYATLKVDGNRYGTPVAFKRGDKVLNNLPAVPQKDGYYGKWEYSLNDCDCVATANYIDGVHYATFMIDGVEIKKVPFSRDGEFIEEVPNVTQKLGYTSQWEEFTLGDTDITVNAIIKPITYYITFMVDGVQIGDKVAFTVNDGQVNEPDIPKKSGYTATWEKYKLEASNITVNAVYVKVNKSNNKGCNSSINSILPSFALLISALFLRKNKK